MSDAMSSCPHCKVELRSHVASDGSTTPLPGDCTLCVHCCGLIQFDKDMQLVSMEPSEAPEELSQYQKGVLAARAAQKNPSPPDALTVAEAFMREMDRGLSVLANTIPAECHVCHETKELRVGACFTCQDLVRTDLIEAWTFANPENRWPYMYRGEPFDGISEKIATEAQAMVERLTNKKTDK